MTKVEDAAPQVPNHSAADAFSSGSTVLIAGDTAYSATSRDAGSNYASTFPVRSDSGLDRKTHASVDRNKPGDSQPTIKTEAKQSAAFKGPGTLQSPGLNQPSNIGQPVQLGKIQREKERRLLDLDDADLELEGKQLELQAKKLQLKRKREQLG